MKKLKFTKKFVKQISGVLGNAKHFRHFQAYKVFHTLYTMKKRVFMIVFFLLLLFPAVFGEINIKQNLEEYNLGDKISVSASVIEDSDIDGFFKTMLECQNYVMQYFVTPISLEKDFRTAVNVPDLTATKDMLGSCKIKAALEGSNGTIGAVYTNEFKVKNELNVSCESAEATPSEEIEINCNARKLSLELVKTGTAKLDYKENHYTTNIEDGVFGFKILIQDSTPAGMEKMAVDVEDSKGNYGDLIFDVNVKAIPTKLEIRVNKESFKPGETLEIKPVLYDHVNDFINTTISLEFIDSKDKKIISKDILSGEIVSFAFDSFALPGDYKITATSEGLANEKFVGVEILSKLEMSYSNEKVLVKNIGNILYDDKTTIVLENDEGEKFLIEKKLKLKPGEEKEIDLSKEVPYGNYDVVLPEESVEKTNETETINVVKNVEINDNRPVYKKIGEGAGTGLGMVTGAAIGTVGFISTRPLFASIILIVIILVIVLFYSKDFIRSRMGIVKIKFDKKKGINIKIPKKKEGEVEGLFEDYKYGKQ